MRVEKYVTQLRGETTHPKGESRVGSENLKERLDKMIAESKIAFPEGQMEAKKDQSEQGRPYSFQLTGWHLKHAPS